MLPSRCASEVHFPAQPSVDTLDFLLELQEVDPRHEGFVPKVRVTTT